MSVLLTACFTLQSGRVTFCGNRNFFRGDEKGLKTDIAEPTHNPVWNATLEFSNVQPDTLMDRTMEITLWDACPGPERETFFLGGCKID